MPRAASACDSRSAIERPAGLPLLRSVRSVSPSIDTTLPAGRLPAAGVPDIRVPRPSGLKVFLTAIGIDLATAGPMVAGWSTLAPAWDISSASSYVSSGMTKVPGMVFE